MRHVFAVASSLDSQIIGEPQVLGQVREGHRAASAAGMVGRELGQLFQAAYGAAKRVRSETTIGERAVSIASAAAQIAGDIHGDLKDVGVLVIGLGEIADLIVRQLKAAGAGQIALTGNGRRAEREAQALGYRYLPMEELDQGLVRADITVTAAGLGKYLVEKRPWTERFEAGVIGPCCSWMAVCPTISSRSTISAMLSSIPWMIWSRWHSRAECSVKRWPAKLGQLSMRRSRAGQLAWPRVRRRLPWSHCARISKTLRQDVLTEQPHVNADEATRLLINRLLNAPTIVLRELATQGDTTQTTDALVRRLFALDENDTTEKEE